MTAPRVAFFTDSFLEVNGVARTSRQFAKFASTHNLPFFSVHTGPETSSWSEGSVQTSELKNSRFVIPLETDLAFDLLYIRHRARLYRELKAFRPDLLHVTGPGHIGMLGAVLARQLRIPLVASWHTNLHEFGGRRLRKILRFLPAPIRRLASAVAEGMALGLVLWLYNFARLFFAPNPELVNMLRKTSQRATYLMQRGIDTSLFSPQHRTRPDGEFIIGYVGRLSPEKNVRLLVEIERQLIARGLRDYRFLVIGDGGDRQWLAANLQHFELPGVLLGHELATAYANMDVFVFPSETDTFGNVVLEAMSSGLPALVSSGGGPKYIIRPGIDGFAADGAGTFADRIMALYLNPALRHTMSESARAGACAYSWDAVFSGVYGRYEEFLAERSLASMRTKRRSSVHSPS